MIKKCSINDIKEIVDFVYRKNNKPEHNSAFCSLKYDTIQKDFVNTLESEIHAVVGYYKDDTLIGVISFYVDEEKQIADCIGPFVEGDYCKLAKAMIDYVKPLFKQSLSLNFFFDKRNIECILLMDLICAENKGNESILTLKRDNYKKQEFAVSVEKLTPEYEDQLIELHDFIFPDVYVSGKDIIQSIGINRQVFCIIENGRLSGYSVLKTPSVGTKATAEVIGVDEGFRRKGYGRALLNAVVKEAFNQSNIDEIHLVVENINQNAIELYYSLGFELHVENCFYQAK